MKFEKGEIVKAILTGAIGMILEVHAKEDITTTGYEDGYQVRLPNYDVKKFFEFELTKRKGNK